jgi:hypothetical protein
MKKHVFHNLFYWLFKGSMCQNEFPKEKDFLWTSMLLLIKYYLSKQLKKNEIGRGCHTYEREERSVKSFCEETWKWPLRRPRHRRNIQMHMWEIGCCPCTGLIWIKIRKDKWWSPDNTIMNLPVPYNMRNFCTSWGNLCFSRPLIYGVSVLLMPKMHHHSNNHTTRE